MNEQCDDSTRRFPWRWGIALIVMLVLYIVSYGPAVVVINESGLVDNSTFMRCFALTYYPLAWIAHSTETESWINHYTTSCIRLWNDVLDP